MTAGRGEQRDGCAPVLEAPLHWGRGGGPKGHNGNLVCVTQGFAEHVGTGKPRETPGNTRKY